jgi:mono/diheme cytochrome c family protein
MTNMLRKIGVGVTLAAFFLLALLTPANKIRATVNQEVSAANPADFYKAKCTACHGAKAEKKFDATLPEEQLVDVVLKGKKGEKPPNMPGFEAKGVTADQAKALVDYMKQLKSSAGS